MSTAGLGWGTGLCNAELDVEIEVMKIQNILRECFADLAAFSLSDESGI